MPTLPIPFTGANKNSDEGIQSQAGWDLFNAIVDEMGNLRRVPGYTSFADLSTGFGITGLHYNEKNDLVIAVSGDQVFIIAEDGIVTDVTGTGIPSIGVPCTFADFADDVYIANGGQIIGVPLDWTQKSLVDGTNNFWKGSPVSLSDGSTDLWTDSPTTPGEYYYTGADAPRDPDSVTANSVAMVVGILGSLVSGEYAWGDQDTLGADTLYVNVGGDPDSQASGYIKAVFGIYYYTGVKLTTVPNTVTIDDSLATKVDIGSLTDGDWAWGDQDSIGKDSLYVQLAVGDPDAQSADYITATVDKTYYIVDSDAPTAVTNIANLNSYLLANNGTKGRVDFSDSGTPETWAGEFFTFEASNDQLQFFGVGDGYDRIHGFGTKSVEPWRNDGSTPFIPEGQEFVSQGSISPYSPVWIRDTWFYVDQFKNLCRINGRQAQRLPQQNYRGLTAFLTGLYCEDIIAMHVYSNGYHWYVATLPTEHKTFAYNTDLDQWGEWSYWDVRNGEHCQYRPQTSTYATGWQLSLLGDSRSGAVYSMSPKTFTANNDVIRASIKTGFINRGDTVKTKFCNRIAGRVTKNNVNDGDATLKVAIRWRDKNIESAWCQEEIDLFTEDGLNYDYFINGLGSYTSRQWEIICTSNIDFQMTPPEEEFDVSYR